MSNIDATRVMGAVGAGATMQLPTQGDPLRTQMGGVTICPVCRSSASLLDPYCGDCGFLLTSIAADAPVELPSEEAPAAELIDETGRRFRLKLGPNTVGRQGTDVLSPEGTVSRNHAVITVGADGIKVEDLGSSNGTKVGDLRLKANETVAAVPGTPLRFGNWRVTLEAAAPTTPAAPAEATIVLATDRTVVEPTQAVAALDADVVVEEVETVPAVAAAPVARLLKLEGLADEIVITNDLISIGRRAGNTLVIVDPYLSGKHAEISTEDGSVYLTDLGSTNGTFVNGQRLSANAKQLLIAFDEVQLGQTKYQFALDLSEPETDPRPLAEDGTASSIE